MNTGGACLERKKIRAKIAFIESWFLSLKKLEQSKKFGAKQYFGPRNARGRKKVSMLLEDLRMRAFRGDFEWRNEG